MNNTNPYQAPTSVELVEPILPGQHASQLQRVRTGLHAVYYGIVAILFAMLAGTIVAMVSGMAGAGMIAGFVVMGIGLTMIGGAIAILVGQVLCMSVPSESGARGMITGSVISQVLGFSLSLGAILIAIFARASSTGSSATVPTGVAILGMFQTISMTSGLVSLYLFLIFLKRLNNFVGNWPLALKASSVIRLMSVLIVGYFALIGWAIYAASDESNQRGAASEFAIGVGVLIGFVLGLITFVKYANLVIYSAKAIAPSPMQSDTYAA